MTGNKHRLGDCVVEGCRAPILALKHCQLHYGRLNAGIPLDYTPPVYDPVCAYFDCDAISAVKGLCRPHYRTWWKYGVTITKDDSCVACGSTDRLVIDHDHGCCDTRKLNKTCGKCVRGILCTGCNLTLGHAGDSVDRLEKLITYLKGRAEKPAENFFELEAF